jgi:hypothetical protein
MTIETGHRGNKNAVVENIFTENAELLHGSDDYSWKPLRGSSCLQMQDGKISDRGIGQF